MRPGRGARRRAGPQLAISSRTSRWGFVALAAVPIALGYVLSGCVAVAAGNVEVSLANGAPCAETVHALVRSVQGNVTSSQGATPGSPPVTSPGNGVSLLLQYETCAPPPFQASQACSSGRCLWQFDWSRAECARWGGSAIYGLGTGSFEIRCDHKASDATTRTILLRMITQPVDAATVHTSVHEMQMDLRFWANSTAGGQIFALGGLTVAAI